jgi:hypothetical protein
LIIGTTLKGITREKALFHSLGTHRHKNRLKRERKVLQKTRAKIGLASGHSLEYRKKKV